MNQKSEQRQSSRLATLAADHRVMCHKNISFK
jgi:hypothetical protein